MAHSSFVLSIDFDAHGTAMDCDVLPLFDCDGESGMQTGNGKANGSQQPHTIKQAAAKFVV